MITDNDYINKYIEAIQGYEPSKEFEPCEVVFQIQSPVYIGHPWLNLDSLIAFMVIRDVLGDDYRNLPNKIPLPLDEILELPVMKTGDVYHTSISFMDSNDKNLAVIYKKFETQYLNHLTKSKRKGKIRKGSGPFKGYRLTLPYISAKTITFYANADINELTRLLSNVTNLGMKRSIGSGQIKKMDITGIDNDYSLTREGKAQRPLPIKIFGPGMKMAQLAYKPPYWNKHNVDMCIWPGSKIGLEG